MEIITQISSVTQASSALKERKLTFFLGAGVSASCGVPLWEELKTFLFKDIVSPYESSDSAYQKIKEYLEKTKGLKLPKETEIGKYPEVIFSIAEEIYGKNFINSFLHRHFSQFKFNISYKAILSFVKWGYLDHIFTVNQDAILQKLLIQKQVPFYDIIPYITDKEIFSRSNFIIFSMHGNLLVPNSVLSNIEYIVSEDLEEIYQKYNYIKIQKYLNLYDKLVVIGYRGADRDVIKFFIEYLKQNSYAEILWSYRSERSLEEIKKHIESNKEFKDFIKEKRIKFFQIKNSDEFLNSFIHNCSFNGLKSKVFLKFISFPRWEIFVKVHGSVAVIGDFGVYANGKMVQYTTNLPCIISAKPSENLEVEFQYFDPFNNHWKRDGDRAKKIQNVIFQFFDKECKEKFNYSIKFAQFFPPGAGLGDVEPAGITVLLYYLGYQEESLLWNIFQKMATEPLYYDHTSYLRPFASFFPPGSYTVGERASLPQGEGSYKDLNWKRENKKFSLNRLNLSFEFVNPGVFFAISFLPRALKFSSEKSISVIDTASATKILQSPAEFCKQISEITEIFLENMKNKNYKLAGYCLYNVATLFYKKGLMREVELKSIEKLMKYGIITGGKISGSGIGGGQIYLCEANTSPLIKGEEIYEVIYPYLCLLEVSQSFGIEEKIKVVSIKENLIKKFFFKTKDGCFQPVKKDF